MIKYCEQIILFLDKVEESNWKSVFNNLLQNYKSEEELSRKILRLYGGMGSFSDLILYKNGSLCKEENDILDDLRKTLYDKAREIIIKS